MQLFRGGLYRVTLLTAVPASLALSGAARADFYLHHWLNEHEKEKQARVDVKAGYYSSPNDFDGAGALLVPSGFLSYSRIQTDLLVSYGLTSRLSAYGRLAWAHTTLDQTTVVSNNFGFTDSTVGASFRALNLSSKSKFEGLTIDLQAQVDFPLYSNENLTGPALGDATMDFTGGAFAGLPIWRPSGHLLALSAGAGFTYRTDSRSSALPWSVSAKLSPQDRGFVASAIAAGMVSLATDPRAAGLSVSSTTPGVLSGGSFISGAVNPSLLTLRGEAGYRFAPGMTLSAFVAQSVWGQAAPNGFYAGGSFELRFGPGGTGEKIDPASMTGPEYGKSNQGFVNYALEAKVTRVNDRLNLVKLDKGANDGLAVDQVWDIFKIRKDGSTGEAIARGHISSVQSGEAALTIDEYFKEVWIDEGFVAKRPVQ